MPASSSTIRTVAERDGAMDPAYDCRVQARWSRCRPRGGVAGRAGARTCTRTAHSLGPACAVGRHVHAMSRACAGSGSDRSRRRQGGSPMKFRSMRSRRSGPAAPKRLVVALAFTLFSAAALAQEMGVPAGSAGRIAELTARAQRLTLLAELPEEARPEAEALLDRYDALRTAEQELEVARLEALVAALESGDSPAVAREVAESAVADQKVELARQREQLRADVDDLADRFPEAANLFRRLASGRWVAG